MQNKAERFSENVKALFYRTNRNVPEGERGKGVEPPMNTDSVTLSVRRTVEGEALGRNSSLDGLGAGLSFRFKINFKPRTCCFRKAFQSFS